MDPDVTFRELLEAINAGERGRAIELSEALIGWINKGGYLPEFTEEAKHYLFRYFLMSVKEIYNDLNRTLRR